MSATFETDENSGLCIIRCNPPINGSDSFVFTPDVIASWKALRRSPYGERGLKFIDKTGERQIIDTLSQHASRSDNSRIHSLEVSVLQRTLQRLRHIPTRKLRTHRKHHLICHRARPANNFTRRGEEDQPRGTSCALSLVLRFHRPYPSCWAHAVVIHCLESVPIGAGGSWLPLKRLQLVWLGLKPAGSNWSSGCLLTGNM